MSKDGLSFKKTLTLLDQARGEVFPDYAVGVSLLRDGRWLRKTATAGCGEESIFDLASLTKVLSTTTLVLLSEKQGHLDLSAPVQKYFESFPDSRVRVSHLLNHTSGLPAWLDLHSHFHGSNGFGAFDPLRTPPEARRFYERRIIESHVAADFEKKATYSDLGFMLLGWTLEKQNQTSLDALFQMQVARPSALHSLQYLPISPDVVPTENCPWRGHVLRGEVHDDNCYVLGGVAGHAGLFGNVSDVLALGESWLFATSHSRDTLKFEPALEIDSTLAKKYVTLSHPPKSSRVLGWDRVSAENSSAGRYFSPDSFGHLGFTGTSLWIDPVQNLVVTLLTNRVHPTRANEKIKTFRPEFHNSLLSELGFAK